MYMKATLLLILYILTIMCGGGWYIREQKAIISEQKSTIQELTASIAPAIQPEKRKVKVVQQKLNKELICKDVILEYDDLRQKTIQCAYNLQACQATSEVYSKLKQKGQPK